MLGCIMSPSIQATDITKDEALNAIFFEQADEFIKLANQLCQTGKNTQEQRSKVSAAMLFATTRFNTWVAANNFKDGNDMRQAKEQVMQYLMQQFQMMLEDHFDEYCDQFDTYMRFKKD